MNSPHPQIATSLMAGPTQMGGTIVALKYTPIGDRVKYTQVCGYWTMKGRLLRSFVCSFVLFTLLASTLTICDFIAPIIVEDEMSKAYAMAFRDGGHQEGKFPKKSSRKTQIAEGDSASAPDEDPVAPAREALTLMLTGLGLLGAAWLYKGLRFRKRKGNK